MLVRNLTLTLLAASALSACTLAPKTERPALPVANAWPIAAANTGSTATAADLGWRDVFIDPRLQGVIDLALSNNRDLRVATLNIEQSRAQYRIERSALLPRIDASGAATVRSRSTPPVSASPPGKSTCSAASAASRTRPCRTIWPPARSAALSGSA
jgi:multidrug efflux system outer membrane protein